MKDVGVGHLETRITAVEDGQRAIFGKLDAVGGTLTIIQTTLASLQASKPQNWSSVLSVVKDVAILIGLAVGGILYVAGGQNAAQLAVMQDRQAGMLKTIERLIEWRPTVQVERR